MNVVGHDSSLPLSHIRGSAGSPASSLVPSNSHSRQAQTLTTAPACARACVPARDRARVRAVVRGSPVALELPACGCTRAATSKDQARRLINVLGTLARTPRLGNQKTFRTKPTHPSWAQVGSVAARAIAGLPLVIRFAL